MYQAFPDELLPGAGNPLTGGGAYSTLLRTLSAMLAVVLWLLVLTPVAAQENIASAFAESASVYRYQERISLSGANGRQVWDTRSLQRYSRRELSADRVQHEVSPVAIMLKSPDVGIVSSVLDPDKAVRYRAAVSDAGGIDWQAPLPAPTIVSVINDAAAGRSRRNLNEAVRATTSVNLPVLGYEASALISVAPVVIQGFDLAILTYDTDMTSLVVGGIQGKIATKSVLVISRDFRTLYAHVSEHRGEIDVGDNRQSFRLSRSIIQLDKDLKPTFQISALPGKYGLARMVNLRPLSDGPYENLQSIKRPSSTPAVLSVLTLTIDARLSVDAEQNENPLPLLGIMVAISTFDTADTAVTSLVQFTGHVTGNKALTEFEGVGNSVFRAAGEKLGELVGADNPKAWGEASVKVWGVTTTAADVVTVFVNPANLAKANAKLAKFGGKIVSGTAGTLGKHGDKLVKVVDKTVEIAKSDYFKAGMRVIDTTNKCMAEYNKSDEKNAIRFLVESNGCGKDVFDTALELNDEFGMSDDVGSLFQTFPGKIIKASLSNDTQTPRKNDSAEDERNETAASTSGQSPATGGGYEEEVSASGDATHVGNDEKIEPAADQTTEEREAPHMPKIKWR